LTIQDILEELEIKLSEAQSGDTEFLAEHFKALRKRYIAQAKLKIEEMFGEWVGEKQLKGGKK
jgi:hypothetical protein